MSKFIPLAQNPLQDNNLNDTDKGWRKYHHCNYTDEKKHKTLRCRGSGFHGAIVDQNFLLLNVWLFYSDSIHRDDCYTHLVSVEGWQILQMIYDMNII